MTSYTLFEVSWEICNKVGGIHTVINSKLKYANRLTKNYFLMGPYLEHSKEEFIEKEVPDRLKNIFEECKNENIIVHFGYSKYDTLETPTLLVEYEQKKEEINSIKTKLWDNYRIDSLHTSWYDFDAPLLWSWLCGRVIEKISKNQINVIAHAHEWLSGGTIFYLNTNNSHIKTVFTTHATTLGRSLIHNNKKIINETEEEIEKIAYELGVNTKHQTEKTLSEISNSFTTVSDITGRECELYFRNKPNRITYNGIDNEKMGKYTKTNHNNVKDFLEMFSHNHQRLNKNANLMYTCGRNEFENKGYDIIAQSLAKLNNELKQENSKKEIIFFYLVMIGDYQLTQQFKNFQSDYHSGSKGNLSHQLPYSPYNIEDESIISLCKQLGLNNMPEDKVKIILLPNEISKEGNLFQKEFYEIVSEFELGIFPSRYEPWGYTPVESLALKIPTITTTETGFGEYCKQKLPENNIVSILNHTQTLENKSNTLKKFLKNQINQDSNKKEMNKKIALQYALIFDWKNFITLYQKEYERILNNDN